MENILIFIISFLIPFVYYRSLFFVFRKSFDKPTLRSKPDLKIHHLHYGMVFAMISAFLLIFLGENNFVVFFLGFGLGLMFDEFVPALLMESERKKELDAYRKGLWATAILFLAIVLAMIFLYFVI